MKNNKSLEEWKEIGVLFVNTRKNHYKFLNSLFGNIPRNIFDKANKDFDKYFDKLQGTLNNIVSNKFPEEKGNEIINIFYPEE